ncbi:chemotaxis protein [Sulfurimonas sp.]|uniref:chemotaxis protein n=1 Tax=Sulfurimonas sp. TaxID=2022749 RepID=UPI0026140D97|nr:chemotaxis protein [Sulfurimonas sp.]
MTQEELDALMSGGIEMDDEVSEDETLEGDELLESEESEAGDTLAEDESAVQTVTEDDDKDDLAASIEAAELPLPATDENKMVHQLDDVTKESEEKASEIFDIIEGISSDLMEKEETLNAIVEVLNSNVALFKKLLAKFPDIETFQTQLEANEKALVGASTTMESLQNSGDAIMNVMDIMQYQDIHRQKIERVVNVMRSLSRYMSTLFEGKIEDEKRVSSAKHIVGDTSTDVASTDDIEALLEKFGQ